MVRINIIIHADDSDAIADVLDLRVLPKIRDGYLEGYERGEDGERYYFDIQAVEV